MKVLVVGGTGTVGGELVRELLARGHGARVLSRSAPKPGALPHGAEAAVGDLAEPASLAEPLKGVDAVFLAVPVHQEEKRLGINGVEAVKAAKVDRLVYLSVFHADAAPRVPHFAGKLPIEAAVRGSHIPWTILRPNYFMQNEKAFAGALANGIYPQPIGSVGVGAVDVRDIAEAAANALTVPGHDGQTYPLAGPDALTGESAASIYARHLGRPVRYAGDDLDDWSRPLSEFLPGWMVDDLRLMFEHFQSHGMIATGDDLAAFRKVLGREPRRFDSFAAGLAHEIHASQGRGR